jgi:hypothetical protein
VKIYILALILSFSHLLRAESGPDNGTDAVKVTFQQARVKLTDLTKNITDLSSIRGLDSVYVQWSHQMNANNTDRWNLLRYYLKSFRFQYQQEPCGDKKEQTASICYFDENPVDPYVIVSLSRNFSTSVETAMVMLLHEMGHFTGEKSHQFLDGFGADLVELLMHPKELYFRTANTEIVPNVFAAKQGCENATSDQAKNLINLAKIDLMRQCQQAHVVFDIRKMSNVLSGNINYVPGRGYDMRVSCSIESLYRIEN